MIVRKCAQPGCDTLVVGGFCLEHEAPQTRSFVRGRPFARTELAALVAAEPRTSTTSAFALPVGEPAAQGLTRAGGRLPSSA